MTIFFTIAANANSSTKASASNNGIGVMLTPLYHYDDVLYFSIYIKNLSNVALTNIYFTNEMGINVIGGPISLAPGEEDYQTYTGAKYFNCYDSSIITVHATTDGGDEVIDMSSPFDFYTDELSYYWVDDTLVGEQDGSYVDANNNSIVDVGDHVSYFYFVPSNNVGIMDDNAIISTNEGVGPFSTTGVHYLTAADISTGYVYNNSYIQVFDGCSGYGYFIDPTPCDVCPVPDNCSTCIVTALTSDFPNNISGTVTFNNNNDCDTAVSYNGRKVTTSDSFTTYASYTNTDGSYNILIPTSGAFTTEALSNLGSNFSSSPTSIMTVSSGANNNYQGNNFCISSATNYSDLTVSLIPLNQAQPGFAVSYIIFYKNNGSTSLNGTINLTFDINKVSFSSSTPVQNSLAAGSATWNYVNLLPFEQRLIIVNSMVLPPPAVSVADILQFTLTGNPIAGDNNPTDNIYTLSQNVFSSYDPNDKTVVEGAYITETQADGYLHYITRFQNNGNAAATTVVLKEFLDQNLIWNTFEPLGASHPYNIQIVGGNDLTCTFSNIGLADSTSNEPASHGWFAYKIKPQANFQLGDIASSQSDIFFDFNPPITTNEVTTQLAPLSTNGFSRDNFKLYPNPADDVLNFIATESISIITLDIVDLTGRTVFSGKITDSKIDIKKLSSGTYIIRLTTIDGAEITQKFIKN